MREVMLCSLHSLTYCSVSTRFQNFYMRDVILCSSIQANQLTFAGKSKYRRSCADWSKPTPIKSIIRPSAL